MNAHKKTAASKAASTRVRVSTNDASDASHAVNAPPSDAQPTATRHIALMDTTLRDGEQTEGVSFNLAEKVSIARVLLESLKVDRIEVASAGVSSGEKQAVARINEWATSEGLSQRVEVLGFVDHKLSVQWIKQSGGAVLNLLAKGSEKHCRGQLRRTPQQHLQDIARTVGYAHEQELLVNVYLEDWSNGYADSRGYVYQLVEGLLQLGVARVMLPDTLGVMAPQEVYDSIADMTSRFPQARFDFHPHNDYGLATANAMAAVGAGVEAIHCTVNCLGERAGNVSLAEVTVALRDKMGVELSLDETHIVSASQMVERFSGKRVPGNAPVVGANVFTQTSGIHADGDIKGNLYHSDLNPARFNRERHYALGKMSGKASLLKNLDALGISLSTEDCAKVLQRIVALGDAKASVTTGDLPFLIAEVLQNKEEQRLQLLNCSVTSGLDMESIVSIKVSLDGETLLSSGAGNGGFDAFIVAIKKIMETRGYQLPQLTDYQIMIPRGGQASALTECIITWKDDAHTFRTRALNTNQVFAGIYATMRMLNMKLTSDYKRASEQVPARGVASA